MFVPIQIGHLHRRHSIRLSWHIVAVNSGGMPNIQVHPRIPSRHQDELDAFHPASPTVGKNFLSFMNSSLSTYSGAILNDKPVQKSTE
jgi:hypothetical protein